MTDRWCGDGRASWLAAWLLVVASAGVVMARPAQGGGLIARVTSPAGFAVEDAAVVLEPLSGTVPPKHKQAVIEQKDREFKPYLTIVQTGSDIDFPNRDPFKHHIYSFSPPKVFEVKLYGADKPAKPILFDKPGEVVLGCNIHDWMEAYVLVVDSPYFAKTDATGRARIDAVPPGKYRLRVWHPRQKKEQATGEFEISSKSSEANLTLDIAPRIVKPKPPLGADRDSY
ncbi:methylamine utilization protein [Andreprevotia chitinilytica]|uniref:methylamine utilization protein n=1 Tax=Andreprevotia chitinilytica TaxID=396808 RepID=UPI0012EB53C2|nr:methylamine utilization protein [Andreprevotia chitinilytica]